MKRGYLLPEGCKDLVDTLKPQIEQKQNVSSKPAQQPAIIGEIAVTEQMTVGEVAGSLKQKPFQIIADLMELGVFANVHQQIPFEIIVHVMRKYGFRAKKTV